MRRYILYVGAALAALTACNENIDEVLLQRSDISLTVKGELMMSYDENTCQLGYNQERNEFRVYDDNIANWFIISCDAHPSSVGQEVTADLEYTTADDTKTYSNLEFSVEKTSSDGLIWLWCKDKQIGLVVKAL